MADQAKCECEEPNTSGSSLAQGYQHQVGTILHFAVPKSKCNFSIPYRNISY